MFDFDEALRLVPRQTILCVGDVMLDDFVYGEVTRISPEAPAPVLAVKHNAIEIGGAGNVARDIAALGASCIFVGLIGNDEAGFILRDAFAKVGAVVPKLVVDRTRPTTRKVRFVSEHHSTHLMRADWETAAAAGAESQSPKRPCQRPMRWCFPTMPRACSLSPSSAPLSRRRGAQPSQ
jgi:D-beta-D-heptose 7-phosphate kinase / D-beta-D-heptose 1-phosphate adenosyltransferase